MKHVTVAMFTKAPMGIVNQVYIDCACTGMIILEEETHCDSHQDPDTPMESTPSVVVSFYKEEKKRASAG